MALKIFHTADIHLGVKLNFLRDKAAMQRQAVKDAFAVSVRSAIDHKADMFLIAGDLFDSPFPSEANIDFVAEQLEKLIAGQIFVAIIAGNHDLLLKGSVFINSKLTKLESPYLKIFNKGGYEQWSIDQLNTVIHACSIKDKNSQTSPLTGFKPVAAKINVGLIHGNVDQTPGMANHPIKLEDIAKSGMNYLALGDWHSTKSVGSTAVTAWYCGSPELINIAQTGSGNCLVVNISDQVKVERVVVGKRKLINIDIELGNLKDYADLKKRIIGGTDKDAIAIINLKGNKRMDIDLNPLQGDLSDNFFATVLKDTTSIGISPQMLKEFPPNSLLAKFVENLQAKKTKDPNHNQLIDQAIQLGLSLASSTNGN